MKLINKTMTNKEYEILSQKLHFIEKDLCDSLDDLKKELLEMIKEN